MSVLLSSYYFIANTVSRVLLLKLINLPNVSKRRLLTMGCGLILGAAIPGFFLSSLFTMLLWGVIAPKFGGGEISYAMAMLITISLWIVVAPLAAAASRGRWFGK